MRVLLLHPEDSPWRGEWHAQRWDVVVDLGFASAYVYQEWSRRLGARVFGIHQLCSDGEGYRWVNQFLQHGRERLFDRMGLDWWEILSVWAYLDLHALYLLKRVQTELSGDHIEVAATRPHRFAQIFEQLLQQPVHYLAKSSTGPFVRAARMLRLARKLRPAQIVEIAFDKWDPGYLLRRCTTKHRRANARDPVALLPSAYSNVTRSVLAYATQLPHRRFLLVTTRHSAIPQRIPENVTAVPLAAYALSLDDSREEIGELRNSWQRLRQAMEREAPDFAYTSKAGIWDHFPAHVETGVRVRNAWNNLLTSEPVEAVLCGDDLNYYTRLPLILAKHSGLNALYCSHGALDGGFLFKVPFADAFLVKGEMESDYLQDARAIEPEKIIAGAPGPNAFEERSSKRQPNELVFFSQPYEVEGGRADEIYRELLPCLYSAACRSGKKLTVKLHPFESERERGALTRAVLGKEAYERVRIVSRVPVEQVIAHAWCGVTIDSSVAVECALRGVPFFLCGWLDFMGLGYLRQFARFGVGHVLGSPEAIEQIPALVAAHIVDLNSIERLWREADRVELDRIMFSPRHVQAPNSCAC